MVKLTAAEHARSVLARAVGAHVEFLDAEGGQAEVHALLVDDGTPRTVRRPGRPVRVEIADVAPLPVPDRIRARVRLHGRAHRGEDHGLLVVSPTAVELVRGGLTSAVSPEDLRDARPDALARAEGGLLTHLVAAHADLVDVLAAALPADRTQVVPLGVDRHGLDLRVVRGPGYDDVRLGFDQPAVDGATLREQLVGLAISARCAAGGCACRTRRRTVSELLRLAPAVERICSTDPKD